VRRSAAVRARVHSHSGLHRGAHSATATAWHDAVQRASRSCVLRRELLARRA
jgi:hypothetical protein